MSGANAGGYEPEIPSTVPGFKRLHVFGFQQFDDVEIDLSGRLTVITGANGAGKTTLLKILGSHFNWHSSFLSSPTPKAQDQLRKAELAARKVEDPRLRSLIRQEIEELEEQRRSHPYYGGPHPDDAHYVGAIEYRGGTSSSIQQYDNSNAIEFSVGMTRQQDVEGLYIGSHRAIAPYREVHEIPAKFSPPDRILDEFISQLRSTLGYEQYSSGNDSGSMHQMKKTLLAAALYGEGNGSVTPDSTAKDVWAGFQQVLKLILPPSAGFNRLVSHPPEIVIETQRGEFPIDSLSGGLRALFELAWQIHLKAFNTESFTVCIDEPENHLHPSLQRSLVPSLMQAFPRTNFILATHSPFVVTASEDASVYALRYNSEDFVISERLDFADKALSAERTLTEILGVETTSPIWVENKYQAILNQSHTSAADAENLATLLDNLTRNGLGQLVPKAIRDVVNLSATTFEEDPQGE